MSVQRTRRCHVEEGDLDAPGCRTGPTPRRRTPLPRKMLLQVVHGLPTFRQDDALGIEWVTSHDVLETALLLARRAHRLDAHLHEPVALIRLDRKHTLDDHCGHSLLSRRWAHLPGAPLFRGPASERICHLGPSRQGAGTARSGDPTRWGMGSSRLPGQTIWHAWIASRSCQTEKRRAGDEHTLAEDRADQLCLGWLPRVDRRVGGFLTRINRSPDRSHHALHAPSWPRCRVATVP